MSFFTDSRRTVDYSSLRRKDRLKYLWKWRHARCNFLNERRGVEVITPAPCILGSNFNPSKEIPQQPPKEPHARCTTYADGTVSL